MKFLGWLVPATVITETKVIHLVLFVMWNRTIGPFFAAIDRIPISVPRSQGVPGALCNSAEALLWKWWALCAEDQARSWKTSKTGLLTEGLLMAGLLLGTGRQNWQTDRTATQGRNAPACPPRSQGAQKGILGKGVALQPAFRGRPPCWVSPCAVLRWAPRTDPSRSTAPQTTPLRRRATARRRGTAPRRPRASRRPSTSCTRSKEISPP
jgi:hypothetical protein